MNRTTRRTWAAGGALGVAGLMLPIGGAAQAEDPAFSGFSSESTASPLRIEVYEPTIPIPASPQGELLLGYSRVEADTSSSSGRASYVWPGDAVGEGFKTIVENLGFPEEVSGPIAAQGYPIQVNSTSPSGEDSQSDEPFPGMVMRTHAAPDRTTAQTGYSTDCQVEPAEDEGDGEGDGGGDGGPGLPDLPLFDALSGLSGSDPSSGSSSTADGTTSSQDSKDAKSTESARSARSAKAGKGAEPEESCRIPAELAALVDFGGYVSTSASTHDAGSVAASSRAALTDIDLIGGVVTISGVHAVSTSTSDGVTGDPGGAAKYGTLSIGGEEFALGPDGVVAGGQQQEIPGLPDDPTKALADLGITITVPKPTFERDGDKAVSQVAALVVEIDTSKLRRMLDDIPFNELVNQLPDDLAELKKVLGAAVNLAPRFVFTFADARTVVDTVQGIEFPTGSTGSGGGGGGESTSGGGSGGGAAGGSGAAAPDVPVAGGAPGGSAPSADGDLTGAEPMGAGLPPLKSIPGALTVGGLALAAAAGTWLRKIGAIALGGAGSCTHGLDSGLPDLRKA